MLKIAILVLTLVATGSAFSQAAPSTPSAPAPAKYKSPEDGWFFFKDPPKKEEPAPVETTKPRLPSELPPAPKEEKCTKKETWSVECGFVNPGTDFEFQSKERDQLMERMSLSKNDPKAVEAFQYYMRWVLERTSEVTNLWWYNMVQNPDLDPSVRAPVSAFGLRLMTDVQKGSDAEIFNLIKNEGGFFIYFSRTDCEFCHQMMGPIKNLASQTGLEVRNASLDGTCLPGLEQGCVYAPGSIKPAEALQVTTVPALFLFVKPNTWLRVATGVVDTDSMKIRTVQFFTAYRTALMNGVNNSEKGRPSVDFSGAAPSGTAQGIKASGSGGSITPPSEEEINRLLGNNRTK